MKVKQFVIFILVSILVYACSGSNKTDTESKNTESVFVNDPAVELSEETVTVASVSFNPPTSWTDLGPSGMRKAEYSFGPIENETDSATMTVYYFGQGQGGATRANIDRWIAQMQHPDNPDTGEKALEQQLTVNDLQVHVVEVAGTYTAGGMGMGTSVVKENYWMCGVVVEGPEGSLFFKLTGPDKTAKEMTKSFASMIHSVKVN